MEPTCIDASAEARKALVRALVSVRDVSRIARKEGLEYQSLLSTAAYLLSEVAASEEWECAPCEGCGEIAIDRDDEGVPLCGACLKEAECCDE